MQKNIAFNIIVKKLPTDLVLYDVVEIISPIREFIIRF